MLPGGCQTAPTFFARKKSISPSLTVGEKKSPRSEMVSDRSVCLNVLPIWLKPPGQKKINRSAVSLMALPDLKSAVKVV